MIRFFAPQQQQLSASPDVTVSITGQSLAVSRGTPTAASYPNTATDDSFTSINSTASEAISNVLLVSTGAIGRLDFETTALIFLPATLTDGTYNIALLWKYRTPGGSWTNVGTETLSSVSGTFSRVTAGALEEVGELNFTTQQTGLSAYSNYEAQLYARRESATPANTIDITGNATVTAASAGVSVSLAGVSTAASAGTLASSTSKTLTGQSSSLAAGTLTTSKVVSLTGQAVAAQNGNVTASTGATVSITGSSAAVSLGAIAQSLGKGLTGQALTSSTGTVTATSGYAVNLTGATSSVALGTVTKAATKALTGQAVNAALGTVTTSASAIVSLTGLSAPATLGSLSSSISKAISGQSTALAAGDPAPSYDEDEVLGLASTTAFVPATSVMKVSSGSLGKLDFSGLLEYTVSIVTDGIYNAFVIWRYRPLGGSWTDVGTEIEALVPCTVSVGLLDQLGEFDVTATQSGLSVNTAYEVQLYVRRASASPANQLQLYFGTAAVTSGAADGTSTLTGQAVSLSSGSVALSKAVSLSGLQTSVQQQSVTKGLQKAITGQNVTLSQSSVTATNAVTTSITGQALALSQTPTSTTRTVAITGQSASLAQSSVAVENGVVVNISGQALTAVRGNLTSARVLPLVGSSVAIQQGNVQTDSDVIVYLTGASAQLNLEGLGTASQAGISGQQISLDLESVTSSRSLGLNGAAVVVFTGTIGSTLPSVIEEYDVRLFDGLRSRGNQRNPYKSLRGLEHAMWGRVLAECEYVPYVYYAASSPSTLRIGYGRPITGTQEQEEAALSKNREDVWLNGKLTEFYQRVLSANPTAELHEVLTSTLYYYQVECQKSA